MKGKKSLDKDHITIDREQFKILPVRRYVIYSQNIESKFRKWALDLANQESRKHHPKLFIWEEKDNQLIIKRVR